MVVGGRIPSMSVKRNQSGKLEVIRNFSQPAFAWKMIEETDRPARGTGVRPFAQSTLERLFRYVKK